MSVNGEPRPPKQRKPTSAHRWTLPASAAACFASAVTLFERSEDIATEEAAFALLVAGSFITGAWLFQLGSRESKGTDS